MFKLSPELENSSNIHATLAITAKENLQTNNIVLVKSFGITALIFIYPYESKESIVDKDWYTPVYTRTH